MLRAIPSGPRRWDCPAAPMLSRSTAPRSGPSNTSRARGTETPQNSSCGRRRCASKMMLKVEVPHGYVWYGGPRRRVQVDFAPDCAATCKTSFAGSGRNSSRRSAPWSCSVVCRSSHRVVSRHRADAGSVSVRSGLAWRPVWPLAQTVRVAAAGFPRLSSPCGRGSVVCRVPRRLGCVWSTPARRGWSPLIGGTTARYSGLPPRAGGEAVAAADLGPYPWTIPACAGRL